MDKKEYFINRITEHQRNKKEVTGTDLEHFLDLIDEKIDEAANLALGQQKQITEQSLRNTLITIMSLKCLKRTVNMILADKTTVKENVPGLLSAALISTD